MYHHTQLFYYYYYCYHLLVFETGFTLKLMVSLFFLYLLNAGITGGANHFGSYIVLMKHSHRLTLPLKK